MRAGVHAALISKLTLMREAHSEHVCTGVCEGCKTLKHAADVLVGAESDARIADHLILERNALLEIVRTMNVRTGESK